jgi:predicted Rossmann-fold nucleotide-binding protein
MRGRLAKVRPKSAQPSRAKETIAPSPRGRAKPSAGPADAFVSEGARRPKAEAALQAFFGEAKPEQLSPMLKQEVLAAVAHFQKVEGQLPPEHASRLKAHLVDLTRVISKLEQWRPAITIFGTARSSQTDHPDYERLYRPIFDLSVEVGAELARLNEALRTGAGPGNMEGPGKGHIDALAASGGSAEPTRPIEGVPLGADLGDLRTQGIKIRLDASKLTFEQEISPFIQLSEESDGFFGRKLGLVLNSLGMVITHGGWGTAEELAEVMVQRERGKIRDFIAALPGAFYRPMLEALRDHSLVPAETLDYVQVLESAEQLGQVVAQSERVGCEEPLHRAFASLAHELIDGFAVVSLLPQAVLIAGAHSPDEDADALVEAVAERLSRAGVALRTNGGQATTAAVARGVSRAGGDPEQLQVLASKAQPPAVAGIRIDKAFENFPVQKEVASLQMPALVLGRPDTESFSVLLSTLTLIQTHKLPPIPVVLLGSARFQPILDAINGPMLQNKLISDHDPGLITVTDDPDYAAKVVLEGL